MNFKNLVRQYLYSVHRCRMLRQYLYCATILISLHFLYVCRFLQAYWCGDFLTILRYFYHNGKTSMRGFFSCVQAFFGAHFVSVFITVTVRALRGAEHYFNPPFMFKPASISTYCRGTVSGDLHLF
jgi:hypothetical protein